jgi:hypothetical protein
MQVRMLPIETPNSGPTEEEYWEEQQLEVEALKEEMKRDDPKRYEKLQELEKKHFRDGLEVPSPVPSAPGQPKVQRLS